VVITFVAAEKWRDRLRRAAKIQNPPPEPVLIALPDRRVAHGSYHHQKGRRQRDRDVASAYTADLIADKGIAENSGQMVDIEAFIANHDRISHHYLVHG
jgi:hypothetical protein